VAAAAAKSLNDYWQAELLRREIELGNVRREAADRARADARQIRNLEQKVDRLERHIWQQLPPPPPT
jgi:hypothetical protein